ncbi:MAG: hypothetical protein VW239_02870 [Candidatus Nanopelagicales bacterium]
MEAFRRQDGSLLLGYEREFPNVRDAAHLIGLPISVFDGLVLAVLKVPRDALTASGKVAKIVTWHDGVYYDKHGLAYKEKDLEWIEEATA